MLPLHVKLPGMQVSRLGSGWKRRSQRNRSARRRQVMSLRQIAKELGISPAYLSYMLNGKSPWRKDLYQRYMGVVNTFVNSGRALANHEEKPPYLIADAGTNHGMAQSGRAPAWGVGGRRFESDHPDQKKKRVLPVWKELFFAVSELMTTRSRPARSVSHPPPRARSPLRPPVSQGRPCR